MFILETYSTAVIFCVITMLCWGSWANTQKLAASLTEMAKQGLAEAAAPPIKD